MVGRRQVLPEMLRSSKDLLEIPGQVVPRCQQDAHHIAVNGVGGQGADIFRIVPGREQHVKAQRAQIRCGGVFAGEVAVLPVCKDDPPVKERKRSGGIPVRAVCNEEISFVDIILEIAEVHKHIVPQDGPPPGLCKVLRQPVGVFRKELVGLALAAGRTGSERKGFVKAQMELGDAAVQVLHVLPYLGK